jgi:DNA-binding winged helix-turn-helix (wHTH) protein
MANQEMDAFVDTQTYRFRDFELDLGARQLRRNGEPVRLERRPMDLLVLLVTRHGLLVPREEIIERLWPGNVVIEFDTGLNTLVRKVRQALGDSSDNPAFIETAAGLGYRFIAPIELATIPDLSDEQPVTARANPVLRSIALLILLLLAIGSAIFVWQSNVTKPEQTRIAVFPFENLTGGIAMDCSRRETIKSTGVGRMHRDQLPLKVRRQFRNLESMTIDCATQFIRVCFRSRSLFQVYKAGNPARYLHPLVSKGRCPGAYAVQRIKRRSFAGELSQEYCRSLDGAHN